MNIKQELLIKYLVQSFWRLISMDFEYEELTEEEMKQIEKAMQGPFMSESEFLKKHPELI